MRYIKYKRTGLAYKYAMKAHYANLTQDEKRIVRKEKFWAAFTFMLFLSFLYADIYFIILIPEPSFWLLRILYYIGIPIIGVALLLISILLTAVITKPLWNKVGKYNLPTMKKVIFQQSCAHLREFYQLQDPYIITKCYESTDIGFSKRDVCIFIANDELRITVDIVHGFLSGDKDRGCYCFNKDEITLSKICKDKLLILELKCENTVFYLGYRAKGFIQRNFANSL